MKWLILLLSCCSFTVLGQNKAYFTLVADTDSFPHCATIFHANGSYTYHLADSPKLKFKQTVFIQPAELISNERCSLLGDSDFFSTFGAYEIPHLHYVALSKLQADSLVQARSDENSNDANYLVRTRAFHFTTDELYSRFRLIHAQESGWAKQEREEREEIERIENQRIQDSIVQAEFNAYLNSEGANTDYSGWGTIVMDGVYYPEFDPYDFYYREVLVPLTNDSLERIRVKVHRQIEPRIDSLLQPFYLSKYEVSNKEYREFVNWVKDSIARELIYLHLEDDDEATRYIRHYPRYETIVEDGDESQEVLEFDPSERVKNRKIFHLNWNQKIDYNDPEIRALLRFNTGLYYPQNERFYSRLEIDPRTLNYSFKGQKINTYPDTVGMQRLYADFESSPFINGYFSDPAFDDYPVVNISYEQVLAYCHWKEIQVNRQLKDPEWQIRVSPPTVVQYEWALKQALPAYLVDEIHSAPPAHFVRFTRELTRGIPLFLNPVGTTQKGSKSVKRKHATGSGLSDIPDAQQAKHDIATFNAWSERHTNALFFDLYGNVSEITSTPQVLDGAEAHQVIGGNFLTGIAVKGDDAYNAVFGSYVQKDSQSRPFTGFRMVYTLERIHTMSQ